MTYNCAATALHTVPATHTLILAGGHMSFLLCDECAERARFHGLTVEPLAPVDPEPDRIDQIGAQVTRISPEAHQIGEVGEVVEIGAPGTFHAGAVRVHWPTAGAYGRGARTWVRIDRLRLSSAAVPTPAPTAATQPETPKTKETAAQRRKRIEAEKAASPVRIEIWKNWNSDREEKPFNLIVIRAGEELERHDEILTPEAVALIHAGIINRYPSATTKRMNY
jgi:hypothetical protein